jgi:hypothetical protein
MLLSFLNLHFKFVALLFLVFKLCGKFRDLGVFLLNLNFEFIFDFRNGFLKNYDELIFFSNETLHACKLCPIKILLAKWCIVWILDLLLHDIELCFCLSEFKIKRFVLRFELGTLIIQRCLLSTFIKELDVLLCSFVQLFV